MTMEMSMGLAKHYGITVSSEDAPKIIHAIQTAYATGRADGREDCAKIFDGLTGTEWFAENVAEEIRSRGQQ